MLYSILRMRISLNGKQVCLETFSRAPFASKVALEHLRNFIT